MEWNATKLEQLSFDLTSERFVVAYLLKAKMSLADGPALRPDGPRSGLSAVVARTVRARAESVRVPSFSRDLLPKTAGWKRIQTSPFI
jgi:hypothetical protein